MEGGASALRLPLVSISRGVNSVFRARAACAENRSRHTSVVIQKQSDFVGGSHRLVVPAFAWPKSPRFDSWHEHAVSVEYLGLAQGDSGAYYLAFFCHLIDAQSWFYFSDSPMQYDQASELLESILNFVPSGYSSAAVGEGFNKIARSLLNVKLPESQVGDWQSSH